MYLLFIYFFSELSIIKQKSLKIDQELEVSESKTKDLKLCIQKFTSKLELLNEKIYKKRIHHDFEETEFEHEQTELSQKLKVILQFKFNI